MERISKFRAFLLMALFLVVLVLFSFKLFGLQVGQTNTNISNVTTYSTITRVKAARGDITDRNGNILVGNRASYDLVFNHYVIISSDNTNESLVKLIDKCDELGVKYNDHFPVTRTRPFEYTLDNYSAAWRGYFQSFLSDDWCGLDSDITAPLLIQKLREVYKIPSDWSDEDARAVIGLRYELDLRNVTNLSSYIFIEDVSDEHLAVILELNVPGLMVEASTVREYHTKYAAHILGSVGAMDAADWEYYKEKGYAMDAYIGQSGFEEAFELELHAVDGTRLDVVDKDGTIISQEYVEGEEPKAGNNVETTIDLNLQIVAEDSLADFMEYMVDPARNTTGEGLDAEGAAVIVMEVKTGDVLVCASYPTYDPADLLNNYDAIENADFDPLYNRALLAAYPPGSTYKMCTLVAAMENGKYQYGETIYDEGVFTKYDNFRPTCLAWSSNRRTHQEVDHVKALEVSCNYFFYELGDRLSIEQLDATAKALGLGEHTGIELYENIGHRSNPESKAAQYTGSTAQFFTGDRILTAIGQSENRFTPMQLCVYACTLANKGTRYAATFLNRVVASDYSSLIRENQPRIISDLDISDTTYRAYMEGMTAVINNPKGTARDVMGGPDDSVYDDDGLWPYPDIKVAAKTGTAETFKIFSDNAAFICLAPADNPQIAIAVYGEKAAHGSWMAGVAEDILRAYFYEGAASDVAIYENKLG